MTEQELPEYPEGFYQIENPCGVCKFVIEGRDTWGCQKAKFRLSMEDGPWGSSCPLFENGEGSYDDR